jgi:hypothetical protein
MLFFNSVFGLFKFESILSYLTLKFFNDLLGDDIYLIEGVELVLADLNDLLEVSKLGFINFFGLNLLRQLIFEVLKLLS